MRSRTVARVCDCGRPLEGWWDERGIPGQCIGCYRPTIDCHCTHMSLVVAEDEARARRRAARPWRERAFDAAVNSVFDLWWAWALLFSALALMAAA